MLIFEKGINFEVIKLLIQIIKHKNMRNLNTQLSYDRLGILFLLTGNISAITLLIISFFDFSYFPILLILLSILIMFTGIVFIMLDTCQSSKRLSDIHQKLMLMIERRKEKEEELLVLYRKILIVNCIILPQRKNKKVKKLNICLN